MIAVPCKEYTHLFGVEQTLGSEWTYVSVYLLPKGIRNPDPGTGELVFRLRVDSNDSLGSVRSSALVANYLIGWINEQPAAAIRRGPNLQVIRRAVQHCGVLDATRNETEHRQYETAAWE